jgi:nuclear pore complex protein Nup205
LEQVIKETTYVLESCVVENHRREVSHGQVEGIEAWKQLLDMSLMKCFDRLPHDRRENMLFDLLHILPSALRSGNVSENVSVLLAESVLSSITKLREDRQHQIILQSVGGNAESGSLPAERLYTILRNILEGILDSNRVELVRGNLYAALINFIHLIASPNESFELPNQPLSMSLSGSLNQSVASFNPSQSLVLANSVQNMSASTSALLSGTLNAMRDVMERLVAVIARDAIDGSEVWKTIAFMLLDALVQLAGQERQSMVVSALLRHGILSNFVGSLKESDERLQSVLKPDPGTLCVRLALEGVDTDNT